MIKECYTLLKKMEGRPAIWTGENSLKRISVYASGYYDALLDHHFYFTSHTDEPFFDWVAKKLGYYESTAGWVNMIVAFSIGFDPSEINWEDVGNHHITKEEHSKSIRVFYQLLEEYMTDSSHQQT